MVRGGLAFASVTALLGACCLAIVQDSTVEASGGGEQGTGGQQQQGTGGVQRVCPGTDAGAGVTTFAGNGRTTVLNGQTICPDTDGRGGPNGTAQLCAPTCAQFGPDCNLYVGDQWGIRQVDLQGNVSTLLALTVLDAGPIDPDAGVYPVSPAGLAVDSTGSVYFSDQNNQRIWKISSKGHQVILAGGGTRGFGDGAPGVAEFDGPTGMAVDSNGNLYVADSANNRIRKVDPAGNVTTFAGNGVAGNADGRGGPSGNAEFNWPRGVAIDSAGNLFVADAYNSLIRKIDPSGNVTTVAGPGEFERPFGVAVDGRGNLYVADTDKNRIRKVDGAGNVTTLAGDGEEGYADGTLGPNGTAEFDNPPGLAVDSFGAVYVTDDFNNRLRLVVP